jgi:hypothetical protein
MAVSANPYTARLTIVIFRSEMNENMENTIDKAYLELISGSMQESMEGSTRIGAFRG